MARARRRLRDQRARHRARARRGPRRTPRRRGRRRHQRQVYADPDSGRRFREDDPLGGKDPYSASKAAAELVAASYRDSFGLRIATARAGNVIGGGDWAEDRILPDAVRASAGRARRSSSATRPRVRPWQHVLNPLSGYLLLAERLAGSGGVRGGLELRAAARARSSAPSAGSSSASRPRSAAVLEVDGPAGATGRARRRGSGSTPRWPPSASAGPSAGRSSRGRRHRGLVPPVREGEDARAVTLEQIAEFEAGLRALTARAAPRRIARITSEAITPSGPCGAAAIWPARTCA